MPDKNRYLVVLDFSTGIAQLDNVGVFAGTSFDDVSSQACIAWGLVTDAKYKMQVFPLNELEDGWSYYT